MRLIWQSARVALGVALLAILTLRPLLDRMPAVPVRVTSDTPTGDLVQLFAREAGAGVVYADTLPPSRDAAALMAGVAARGNETVLTVRGTAPSLVVTPPVDPVAMRRSALGVTLRAAPDSEVRVTVDGSSGTADTLSVHIGPSGTATVAVAVEPAVAGPGTWTVRAVGQSVTTHAWVQPEAAVRVLLLTGAPGWESRYLARALEAAGASLAVHQALGRDQAVTTSGATPPERMADLEAWDVVALVGPLAAAPSALLRSWVTERGGGLLLVGPLSPATARPASALRWSGPAEIVPLPVAELSPRLAIVPVMGTAVAWSGTTANATVHASADWVGRGRIFTSGIESWPWVMEAGLVDEHRRYWESVVEWLAGGLTADLSLSGGVGRPGVAWMGRLEGDTPTSRRVRLVPTRTGGHPLGSDPALGSGTPLDTGLGEANLGIVVVDGAERGSWTDAALEIGGAGGLIRNAVSVSPAPLPGPLSRPATSRWLLFLTLATLAVAAWATRRIEGQA